MELKVLLIERGDRAILFDVHIERGERFALTVEPVSNEEIYRLLFEVCKGAFENLLEQVDPSTVDVTPVQKVKRVMRIMSLSAAALPALLV